MVFINQSSVRAKGERPIFQQRKHLQFLFRNVAVIIILIRNVAIFIICVLFIVFDKNKQSQIIWPKCTNKSNLCIFFTFPNLDI